jgi:hypothetical protein
LVVLYWMAQRGLGKVILPVSWSVLTNWLRINFMRYCSPGDLDACVIWFDATCSAQKYVGNTVLVLVVL